MSTDHPEEPEEPEETLYLRLLRRWIDLAVRRPAIPLSTGAVLTVVLVALSATLTFDVRWTALLPVDLPAVQEFLRIDEQHENPGALIVVVSGAPGRRLEQGVEAAVEALQPALCPADLDSAECKEADRGIRRITAGLSEDFLARHALVLASPDEAQALAWSLADPGPVAQLTAAAQGFGALAELSPQELVDNQDPLAARVEGLRGYLEALQGEGNPTDAARRLHLGSPYMLSRDGGMAMVLITPAVSSTDAEALPLLDRRVEALLAPLPQRFADLSFERTGIVTVMRDEMDSVGGATVALTLGAALAVLLLLAWALRSLGTAMTSLLPILVGGLWALGVFAVVPGQLNMMTAMVLVILIGLGIDFSLHTVGRFDEELREGAGVHAALMTAFGDTGTGVITGAVSTSVAFYALLVADMRGVQEFGFCAGTGVLITLFAAWWLLPALLVRRARTVSDREARRFSFLATIARGSAKARWVVASLFVLVTTAGFVAGLGVEWEYNLMELEPEGLRSIELQNEVVQRYGASTSFSRITAEDPAESADLRERFEQLDVVAAVDDVSLWLSPADLEPQREAIAMLRLASSAEGELDLSGFDGASTALGEALSSASQALQRADLPLLAGRLDQLPDISRPSPERAAELQAASLAVARTLSESDAAVGVEELPVDLLARYRSAESGRYLVQVIPKKDTYDRDALVTFDEQSASVDPRVTGMPQLLLLMNDGTVTEGKKALLLAFLLIVFAVWLHFRRPLVVLLSLLPLLSGYGVTLGLLALTGQKLNFISIIGLPIILGIGIDNGVHFLHRVLEEGPGRLTEATSGVGRAIVLTSLTTMIGFGSLAFYLHRGMASLGLLLVLGVGACLVVTLLLLPALCRLFEAQLFRAPSG